MGEEKLKMSEEELKRDVTTKIEKTRKLLAIVSPPGDPKDCEAYNSPPRECETETKIKSELEEKHSVFSQETLKLSDESRVSLKSSESDNEGPAAKRLRTSRKLSPKSPTR